MLVVVSGRYVWRNDVNWCNFVKEGDGKENGILKLSFERICVVLDPVL